MKIEEKKKMVVVIYVCNVCYMVREGKEGLWKTFFITLITEVRKKMMKVKILLANTNFVLCYQRYVGNVL